MKKYQAYLIFLLLFISLKSLAQYVDLRKLPENAQSRLIEQFLVALNSNNPDQRINFISENFEESFLNQFPMSDHLGFLDEVSRQQGKLVFYSLRQYEEPRPSTQLTVIVKSARTELWSAFQFYFTDHPAPKIVGIRALPARPPLSEGENTKLNEKQVVHELKVYVDRMAKKDVFSGAVLLAKGEKVLYSDAKGEASKRFSVKNNLQTKFNLGSMNKMFTAIAVMQLVEQKKLSLEDTLDQFLDETWLAKAVSREIKIKHLLTHSSGLGNYFNELFMQSSKLRFRDLSDYKPLIQNESLQFEPGSRYAYSNTGMFLLGVVIEQVSGEDYFDYIQKHIYDQAGMLNSGSYEMDKPVPNLAIGYLPDGEDLKGWRNNLYLHVVKGGPAGGGFSTVEDLHRFAVALNNNILLKASTKEILLSAKPELSAQNYGFGFGVLGSSENRIVGHDGGFDGISSNLDIYLDRGYIAVVLSNYSEGSRPIESKIRQLLANLPISK